MKRKHKNYSRPKRPFDKQRIEEENKIRKEFGLKNKREIWKAEAKIGNIRSQAKRLIKADVEEQEALAKRLQKIGFNVKNLADILSLEKKDLFERRLQTIVVKKKLANTPKHARQLIVHKKILVGGKAINIPSYIVPVELENKIIIKHVSKRQPIKVEAEVMEEKI
ncbi:MAG: 30S ribosomal protein S4 [Nanoarchaeota archaeon]|nr:30S ribosomal protein S4 [Nanoarchaeota archaeon]